MEKALEPVELCTEPYSFSNLSDSLKSLSNCDQNESTASLFNTLVQAIGELQLNRSTPITDVKIGNVPAETVLINCLKQLRLKVTNKHSCDYVLENAAKFLPVLDTLVHYILTEENATALYTKYLLHVLINWLSCSSEQENSERSILLQKYISSNKLQAFFCNAYGCFHEVSALLYNIHRSNCSQIEDIDLIESILLHDVHPNTSNEYTGFLVELLMSQNYVWASYSQLKHQARLALQDSLRDNFIADKPMETLPEECLKCLCHAFKTSIDVVFQVSKDNDLSAIREVALVLENIGHAASVEKFLHILQKDKDLLVNAGVLLINVHRLGQSPDHIFTPLKKLSTIQDDESLRSPITGFKADLIRLVGNLCWKNRTMQDLAREGELIPVLLDSCNIDAKNPFIMQWAILSLRIICDCNQENQAIIAGLSKQGVIKPDALQELGLTLHADGERKFLHQ
uniref:Ataxin-10 n=1 Tax=Dendroctonus ponderosae TaxID=77166 RepID=A0AAR5PAH9_DENPD